MNFDQLPTELKRVVIMHLNQEELIKDLQDQIRILLNRNETLRTANQRLTLQAIQQLSDIQQLEHILANNLDIETREVQRQLDFEDLTDTDHSEVDSDSDVTI